MGAVYFGTPSYDKTICVEHECSMVATAMLCAKAGVTVHRDIIGGGCFLDTIRNDLVERFLATDATDMFMIDADVGWDPHIIGRVIAHPQEVVAGLVPKRAIDKATGLAEYDCYHQNALTGGMTEGAGGVVLLESLEAPTAFIRIKRTAFAKLKEPYFKIGSKKEDFGEDIYFCRRWLETGNYIWIDPDVTFTHRGSFAWKGNFADYCVKAGLIVMKEPQKMRA